MTAGPASHRTGSWGQCRCQSPRSPARGVKPGQPATAPEVRGQCQCQPPGSPATNCATKKRVVGTTGGVRGNPGGEDVSTSTVTSTGRTIVIRTLVTPYTVLCQLMPIAVTPIRQPLPGVTFRIDYECIVTPLSAIKPCDIEINGQLASSYLLYSFSAAVQRT